MGQNATKEEFHITFKDETNLDLTGIDKLILICLGTSETGKSSIIERLMTGSEIKKKYSTTDIRTYSKTVYINQKGIPIELWDTPGEQFTPLGYDFTKKAHGILLCFDISSKYTFKLIQEWAIKGSRTITEKTQVTVVGNKIDLPTYREVDADEAASWASDYGFEYVETSAVTGQNVEEAFYTVLKDILTNKKRVIRAPREKVEEKNSKEEVLNLNPMFGVKNPKDLELEKWLRRKEALKQECKLWKDKYEALTEESKKRKVVSDMVDFSEEKDSQFKKKIVSVKGDAPLQETLYYLFDANRRQLGENLNHNKVIDDIRAKIIQTCGIVETSKLDPQIDNKLLLAVADKYKVEFCVITIIKRSIVCSLYPKVQRYKRRAYLILDFNDLRYDVLAAYKLKAIVSSLEEFTFFKPDDKVTYNKAMELAEGVKASYLKSK